MTVWIRHAVKHLMKNRSFALFFVTNLAMGLAGFISIHSFSISLDRHLEANLKEILTADLALFASRPLTPDELSIADDILGPDTRKARQVIFYTMVTSPRGPKLTQVMAVDGGFPLYGSLDLETYSDPARLQTHPEIVMTRDTANAFGISPGDSLQLGKKSFVFSNVVLADPDRSLASFNIAPKIYLSLNHLDDTGLVRFGSRIRYVYFYRLPETAPLPPLKARLAARFEALSQGHPVISVYDSRDVSRGLGRITRLFSGYLGLVSSVALFLAGIATAYLFRGYLSRQQKQIAIFMSLGATRQNIFGLYALEILILGSIAAALALFFAAVLMPAFPIILKGLIPENLAITIPGTTVFTALGMGIAGSLVFCLPVFYRIFTINPLTLLRESGQTARASSVQRVFRYLAFIPGLAGFLVMAAVLTDSVGRGMAFTGGMLGIMIIISLVGALLFKSCRSLSESRRPVLKIAFRNLYRNSVSSLACFVTISLGAFLICLIPQLQKGLQDELSRPDGLKIPVFFLVDIQEEHVPDLVRFTDQQGAVIPNISPMVRGRILTVNNENFHDRQKQSYAGSPGRQFRRLEFNFSYRQALDTSETVVKGKNLSPEPWDFESGTPFEISVAEEFSQWYQIRIGDDITFDIQGIPFTGRVVNLRKVRWNSFQPNFFLLFQDGVLNDAPKTFLASVAGIAPEARDAFKTAIVQHFPNISVVDVTQTVTTLMAITDRLSLSIKFMAFLAIAAGLVSIFSIARHEARNNRRQILLLKVLGAGFREIRAINLVEFGFIGLTASVTAIVLSLFASWILSWFFFDRLWAVHQGYLLAIPVLTCLTAMLTAQVASGRILKTPPAELLNRDS